MSDLSIKKERVEQRIKELEAELDQLKSESTELSKPKQIENPDLDKLREILSKYVDFVTTDYRDDQDWEYYIFETAIGTFYDSDTFWKWHNGNIE